MLVHGNNLRQKEQHQEKYNDVKSKKLLTEIRKQYDVWTKANERLVGPVAKRDGGDGDLIAERVKLFTVYKDFIDQQKYAEAFDSRSNLHSSVLEEFIYYLFRDLVLNMGHASMIGKATTLKDMFFAPPSYEHMITHAHPRFEGKDHDFVIGGTITLNIQCKGEEHTETKELQLPAVAIECKTYLDKTMLESSSNAAEQIRA